MGYLNLDLSSFGSSNGGGKKTVHSVMSDTITLYNLYDQSATLDNVEADIKHNGNEHYYDIELSTADYLLIFEDREECQIFQGGTVKASLVDTPVAIGGDKYLVKLVATW